MRASIGLKCHIFFFFMRYTFRAKKATQNNSKTNNEIQGKSHPRDDALTVTLECVRGKAYNAPWNTVGRLSTEKKVPQRNVIGRMTRLLKVAIAWCVFASNAALTPKKENAKQDNTIDITKSGVRCRCSGAIASPIAKIMPELTSPLIAPCMDLPKTIADTLNGHMSISSSER